LQVELWLADVEKRMLSSIREQCMQALSSYSYARRTTWVTEWPAMVVLFASSVTWTQGVEHHMKKSSLHTVAAQVLKGLLEVSDLLRGGCTALERLTLSALITCDVHSRDVTQRLVATNITELHDFAWISQLRHYWKVDTPAPGPPAPVSGDSTAPGRADGVVCMAQASYSARMKCPC
jgi:dynein heavy chain